MRIMSGNILSGTKLCLVQVCSQMFRSTDNASQIPLPLSSFPAVVATHVLFRFHVGYLTFGSLVTLGCVITIA